MWRFVSEFYVPFLRDKNSADPVHERRSTIRSGFAFRHVGFLAWNGLPESTRMTEVPMRFIFYSFIRIGFFNINKLVLTLMWYVICYVFFCEYWYLTINKFSLSLLSIRKLFSTFFQQFHFLYFFFALFEFCSKPLCCLQK